MHDIAYNYPPNRNRLLRTQGIGIPVLRYTYDPAGNLLRDKNAAKEMKISWNSAGKVSGVGGVGGVGGLHFDYSPTGQRQEKRTNLGSTYYIHDAAGNVMATYTLKNNLFKVEDLYIYGSGRLGVYRMDDAVTALPGDSVVTRPIGRRQYELTNHLGNVTVTLPDRKSVAAYSANYISYEAVYLSHTDYYPFGYPIAGKSSSNENYRYWFNGQEKDDEIYGKGSAYNFAFRMYDARLGRFWSVDPLTAQYPWNSTYAFAENDVIRFIDLEGLERGVRMPRSNQVPNYRQVNNYARNAHGARLPSIRTIRTTTITSGRNQLGNGTRPIIPENHQYLTNYTTPGGQTVQTSSDLSRGAKILSLFGSQADIKIQKITDRLNTPQGMRTYESTTYSFVDPYKQKEFDELQRQYDEKFNELVSSMDDMELEGPSIGEAGDNLRQMAAKSQKAREILGPSPQAVLESFIKENEGNYSTQPEEKKFQMDEIVPTEY